MENIQLGRRCKHDTNPPRMMLSECEIRGEAVVGNKLTAFARRCSKKVEVMIRRCSMESMPWLGYKTDFSLGFFQRFLATFIGFD